MSHPLKHINPLKVEELRHIPFRSNYVGSDGAPSEGSGYTPDGPGSDYDYLEGLAIHNPYIRPFHLTSNPFVLPAAQFNQPGITPFLSLNFAEFVTLDGHEPDQVVYSTIRVVAYHRLQGQNFLRQKSVTDVLLSRTVNVADFEYTIDVIAQGKVADSSRVGDLNLQIQLVDELSSSPTADLRIVVNNPTNTNLSGQKMISKGYIKYIA
tara:strand:+ start:3088 stop:3714 length:627 start_codon:yes stop_codon:yes gene_type:complete